MEYVAHVLVLVGIYVILSVSLNLIAGYAGHLSVAHAAFYGVGAYVVALLALRLHMPPWVTVPCAVLSSAAFGACVGIPSLRIRGDYFVIATLAFQVLVFSVLNNWVSLTGGPMGLAGIPRLGLFGREISSNTAFLVPVAILCGVTLWVCYRIARSPMGRVLRAIREDEYFAGAMGKDVPRHKVLVFVVGAGLAATAGALYAYYISFVDPKSFTVMESIFIISIVIIGGAGSIWGPVVGATVLVMVPEVLRFVGLPSPVAANLRQLLYGALLVAFVIWRPRGLLGKYGLQPDRTDA